MSPFFICFIQNTTILQSNLDTKHVYLLKPINYQINQKLEKRYPISQN